MSGRSLRSLSGTPNGATANGEIPRCARDDNAVTARARRVAPKRPLKRAKRSVRSSERKRAPAQARADRPDASAPPLRFTMPFTSFHLHRDLLRGIKEIGFQR